MENKKNKKIIFLCGPMRGVPRDVSLGWREKAVKCLSEKFEVLHAMRGREEKETFTDPRAAVIRDLSDIKNADILLVNDTIENCSMIGTSMEIFFAFQQNIPIIIFGNAHDKDYWLNYHIHLRTKDLDEACEVLNKMFS
jgi:nucleoside 2-deoxyribosyltransferase